jgi:hypothetical protein
MPKCLARLQISVPRVVVRCFPAAEHLLCLIEGTTKPYSSGKQGQGLVDKAAGKIKLEVGLGWG